MEDSLTFDQTNPEVKNYLFDVADYWMDNFDIDGYKLHAADQADSEFMKELTQNIKEKNEDFYIIGGLLQGDRKSTRLNSSHVAISYAVFCLKKKKHN